MDVARGFITLSEAETARQRAAEFMQRIGGDSAKFEAMDAREYARSKGKEILENPLSRRNIMTKAQSEETLDQIADILDDADDAGLTREEVIEKVREAAALVEGEQEDLEDDDE